MRALVFAALICTLPRVGTLAQAPGSAADTSQRWRLHLGDVVEIRALESGSVGGSRQVMQCTGAIGALSIDTISVARSDTGVPTLIPVCVNASPSTALSALPMPKSATRACPSCSMMFSGLCRDAPRPAGARSRAARHFTRDPHGLVHGHAAGAELAVNAVAVGEGGA